MTSSTRTWATAAVAALTLFFATPTEAEAQGRGNGARTVSPASSAQAIISADARAEIRAFYATGSAATAQGLPPGIRRNLERGKPLPPGLAKKSAPPELVGRVGVPAGFELVEVGLDVLLVEVATSVIHDVLMDVVR